jgi:hypothetical protein
VVSAKNCSRAATIAAASARDAVPVTISIRGLGGLRVPFLDVVITPSVWGVAGPARFGHRAGAL